MDIERGVQELLDRRVQLEPGGQPGAVVDVAMESSRGGEWSLTRVAASCWAEAVRGMEMPALPKTYWVNPEQSKPEGLEPP